MSKDEAQIDSTLAKQAWEAPTVTALGDLETLTSGVLGGPFDGGGQLSGP